MILPASAGQLFSLKGESDDLAAEFARNHLEVADLCHGYFLSVGRDRAIAASMRG